MNCPRCHRSGHLTFSEDEVRHAPPDATCACGWAGNADDLEVAPTSLLQLALDSLSTLDPIECCGTVEEETAFLAGRGILRALIAKEAKRNALGEDLCAYLHGLWDGGRDDDDYHRAAALYAARIQIGRTPACPVCEDESHPHGGPECPACGRV